jgi:hypothetical protein
MRAALRLRAAIFVLSLAAAPIAVAFQWVKPNEAGAKVRVALSLDDVAACARVGAATATTADRVLGLPRVNDVVVGELTALAQNRAAEMGGDTVVADGSVSHGTQSFSVYRCGG